MQASWGKPIDFCVQAVDLDYLPLADGKKNHCRVLLKLGIDNGAASSTQDIPKDLFNFADGGSGGAFSASTSSGDLVPVFWMISGTNSTYGADSVEKVIALNRKGKIAVAYLRIQPKDAPPK